MVETLTSTLTKYHYKSLAKIKCSGLERSIKETPARCFSDVASRGDAGTIVYLPPGLVDHHGNDSHLTIGFTLAADSDANLTLAVETVVRYCLYWNELSEMWDTSGCVVRIVV